MLWVSMEGMLLFDAKTDSVTWSTFLKEKLKKPGKMPTGQPVSGRSRLTAHSWPLIYDQSSL
jgi:hypothetical protein